MARLGLELPEHLSIAQRAELARWAEERGFESAWSAEISDPDAFVVLAAAALATTTIGLGTAIVPIGPRTAPSLASSAASLAELAPGRFTLGVGVSSKAIVEGWHGLPYDRPLERARETIVAVRAILAGERSAADGRQIRSAGFKLRRPPVPAPAICLAALNEKMLELAGELADSVYLNFVPLAAIERVRAAVQRGRERSRLAAPAELLISIPTCVTDEPDAARRAFAHDLAFYLTAPPYRRALRWYGFEADVAAAEQAWRNGDLDKVRRRLSDRLVDEIGAFGDAEHCRQRIAAYADAGIDMVAVSPLADDPRTTLECFAR